MQNELAFTIKILGKDGELSKLAEIEKGLARARVQRSQLNEAYKQGLITENQLARSTAELNVTTKALNKEKRDIIRTIELETQRAKNQAGTYKSLDATLQLLKGSYKALTLEERNSASGQLLLKKIQATDQTLKRFDNTIGQNQRSVGNYSGALNGLTGVFSSFGGQMGAQIRQLQMIRNSLLAMKKPTEAAAVATVGHAAATGTATASTNLFSRALVRLKAVMISTGAGALLIAVGAVVGTIIVATKRAVEFSKEMSSLRAILGDLATDGSMRILKDQAKELGASTAYTATQVIQAQTELAKLGFTVQEIVDQAPSILDLAAGLGVSLADAASLAGSTMRQFGLDSSESTRVVDVLAKSAAVSALDFEALVEAFKIFAPTARAVNLEIENSAALLGALANNGLKGSIAGTSLARVFIELNKKGLTLNEALEKVRNSSNQLGTSIELVKDRGSKALLGLANGGEDLAKLTKSFSETEGAAKRLAETKLDNITGDTTRLSSAWEGLLLTIEDGDGVFIKASRVIVQTLTYALGFLSTNIELIQVSWARMVDNIKNNIDLWVQFIPAAFNKIGNYLKVFGNNAALIFSKIPIIGESIDKSKIEQNIKDAKEAIIGAQADIDLARKEFHEKSKKINADSVRDTVYNNLKERAVIEETKKVLIKAIADQEDAEKEATKAAEKRKKEEEAARKKELKDIEANNKQILELSQQLRDGKIAAFDDGIRKELFLLDAATEDTIGKLRSELSTEQEIVDAKGAIKEQLIQKNLLINARIKQAQEAHGRGIVAIEEKYNDQSIANDEKTNDLKIQELQNQLKLEELKIRNSFISKEITEDESLKKIHEIQLKYLKLELELIDQSTTAGKLKYQEILNAINEITQGDDEDGGLSGLAKLFDISDEDAELLKQKALDLAQQISDTIFSVNQTRFDNEQRAEGRANDLKKQNAITSLDDQLKKGQISQEKYNATVSQIEIGYDQRKQQMEREAFERGKQMAIVQAAINGALAITNIWATTPKTDFGISTGILIAASAIATGLQIAAIEAQEFAQGGRVFSGEKIPNSAKNISTRSSGDNVAAYVKTNEVVLNERQQAALGGDSTFAAIGVRGFAQGGLIEPLQPPTRLSGISIGGAGISERQMRDILLDNASMIVQGINSKQVKVLERDITDAQSSVSQLDEQSKW
jgi:hypothetical protein